MFYVPKRVLFSGLMNITLSTEAVATEELCGEEMPFVPRQGQKDTIIKLLPVQVRQALTLPRPKVSFVQFTHVVLFWVLPFAIQAV